MTKTLKLDYQIFPYRAFEAAFYVRNIMIRLLNLNDLDAFQEIRALSLKINPLSFGTAFEERRDRATVERSWRTQKEEEHFIMGYFDKSQEENPLVGFMGCIRMSKIKMRHKAEIMGVFVHPDCRRRGIAEQLFEASINKIRGIEGVQKINLTVSLPSIGALKLYQKMGFLEFGREENSMIWEGEQVTTVYMSLSI